MGHTVDDKTGKSQTFDSNDDFDNCKGQCGYTPWCKACMESRKEAEKLVQGTFSGNWPEEEEG